MAVATVNAIYDWGTSDAKRVWREVLLVREKERRLVVTPPVACARQEQTGARGAESKAGSMYGDFSVDTYLGVGVAAWAMRARRSRVRRSRVRRSHRVTHAYSYNAL